MVVVKSNAKKILGTLNYLKAAIHQPRKKALGVCCEITVTDNKIMFAIPGAVFSCECNTQGTCKAAVSFIHFYEIIKSFNEDEIVILITENFIKINHVTISAKTTFFETDKILRTINLSINYTDADVLKLEDNGYTVEELEFNGLTRQLERAKEKLNENIYNAFKKIEIYGVGFDEVEKMVKERLYGKD